VSYCILGEYNLCVNDPHFEVDGNGTIRCKKELDFEELSPLNGTDRRERVLKVMAHDSGSPSLNSTVNVVVNIQVIAMFLFLS
jgi:hypothetical protein